MGIRFDSVHIRRELAGFGCGLMVALFPPLAVYAFNEEALRFPLGNIVAGGVWVGVTLGGLLALATRIPRVGGWLADLCRVGSIAIFLLTVFPNATGEITGMNGFLDGAGNTAPLVKLVCLLSLLLLLRGSKGRIFNALHAASLLIAGLLGLAILAGLRIGGAGEQTMTPERRAQVARLAPSGNVIVIVPDAFTGYRMTEIVTADAALRARFPGFTLYPNAIASAFNTLAGVSVLLTGELEIALDTAIKRRRIERMMAESWLQEALDQTNRAVYFSYLLPQDSPVEIVNEQKYFDTMLLPATSGMRQYRPGEEPVVDAARDHRSGVSRSQARFE